MNACEHDGHRMQLCGLFVVLKTLHPVCFWQLGGQEIKKEFIVLLLFSTPLNNVLLLSRASLYPASLPMAACKKDF